MRQERAANLCPPQAATSLPMPLNVEHVQHGGDWHLGLNICSRLSNFFQALSDEIIFGYYNGTTLKNNT